MAPDILLTHSPVDYMEDHTNTCRLAVTAAFCRGMRNFPVEPPRPAIDNDVTIYHAQPHGNCDPLRQAVVPESFVDVDALMDRKAECSRFIRAKRNGSIAARAWTAISGP